MGVGDYSYKTTQDFEQCLLTQADTIGLINTVDDTAAVDGLVQIYEAVSNSYESIGTGNKLLSKTFTSQDDADDYITSKNYATNKLCFTMQWAEWDPTNAKYSLEIGTAQLQSNMTDT